MAGAGLAGCQNLDTFIGTNDDDKLDAGLSFAASQTYPPTIILGNRPHAFAKGNRPLFKSMRIAGPDGYSNPEQASQTKMATKVILSMAGGWLVNTDAASTFGVDLRNLSFVGSGSKASVITQGAGAGTTYCLHMSNISSTGLLSVLGTQASKLLITAATFDGGCWEINNCYNGAFHLGGSDNNLWTDGMLLDSGVAFNTAGNAAGQYHLWCDYLDKTYIGPLYVTCEGSWNGVRISGPGYNAVLAMLELSGSMAHELRVGTRPSHALGQTSWSRAGNLPLTIAGLHMGKPLLVVLSSKVLDVLVIDGGQYDRVGAETVPYVNSVGGSVRIRDLSVGSRGGIWTSPPRVHAVSAVVDDSVTRV